MVIHQPQGGGIQPAKGLAAQEGVHIVQFVVAVYRGDDGASQSQFEEDAHGVGLGSMAVDDVRLKLTGGFLGQEEIPQGKARLDLQRINAGFLGILSEFPFPHTQKLEFMLLFQAGAEGQDVGLGAAPVAAAGDVQNFHDFLPKAVEVGVDFVYNPKVQAPDFFEKKGNVGFYYIESQGHGQYRRPAPTCVPRR